MEAADAAIQAVLPVVEGNGSTLVAASEKWPEQPVSGDPRGIQRLFTPKGRGSKASPLGRHVTISFYFQKIAVYVVGKAGLEPATLSLEG